MNCTYCAKEIQDGSIVCSYCGRAVLPVKSPIVSGSIEETNLEEANTFKKRFARIRSNLYAIEAFEFGVLSFLAGTFIGLLMIFVPDTSQTDILTKLLSGPLVFLGGFIALVALWGVYLLYIILARAGGPIIDIGLWVLMTSITASFTFWCWTILDINRLIVSKLFYRGEAPVEYAWSHASKLRYKQWKLQQSGILPTTMTNSAPKPMATQEDHLPKLKKLKEMQDAGLITAQDYDTQKAEILSRLMSEPAPIAASTLTATSIPMKLVMELQQGNDRQRRAASYKLGKLKSPEAVTALIGAYNDTDGTVRLNVINGLRTIGTQEALDFLKSHNL
ncbi:MAG: HEAT repeat domain-containing protein [Chloroflexi bacterium]|nr:HEAT repeat domain-containing protein [Chloroflexota bacterium]